MSQDKQQEEKLENYQNNININNEIINNENNINSINKIIDNNIKNESFSKTSFKLSTVNMFNIPIILFFFVFSSIFSFNSLTYFSASFVSFVKSLLFHKSLSRKGFLLYANYI